MAFTHRSVLYSVWCHFPRFALLATRIWQGRKLAKPFCTISFLPQNFFRARLLSKLALSQYGKRVARNETSIHTLVRVRKSRYLRLNFGNRARVVAPPQPHACSLARKSSTEVNSSRYVSFVCEFKIFEPQPYIPDPLKIHLAFSHTVLSL